MEAHLNEHVCTQNSSCSPTKCTLQPDLCEVERAAQAQEEGEEEKVFMHQPFIFSGIWTPPKNRPCYSKDTDSINLDDFEILVPRKLATSYSSMRVSGKEQDLLVMLEKGAALDQKECRQLQSFIEKRDSQLAPIVFAKSLPRFVQLSID